MMDTEYKDIMYGSFFNELDSLQRNKLRKEAGVGQSLKSIWHAGKAGLRDPASASKILKSTYKKGAESGGVLGGVGSVMKTPLGKAVGMGAAGAVGVPLMAGAAGGAMAR